MHHTKWSWHVQTVLRIHGELSNRELSRLVDRPEPRVSEVVRRLEDEGQVTTQRSGRSVIVRLAG